MHAQTRSPGSSTAFDPAAAVGMLTDATKNESSAASPFLGLASRVEVDRLFGTATTTIPIELPPGRKGMTPDLTLRYSSNSGNGPFGVGWDLPLGSIKRNTARGVPLDVVSGQYIDSKGFVLVFRGGTILLDTCKDPGTCNSWGASNEEVWLDVQFNRGANQFVVKDRDGITYTYGAVAAARTGKDTSTYAKTFGWLLTDVQDPNGNAMQVAYTIYDGASYPTQVNYGANTVAGYATHIFHAALGYDVRPDVTSSYRGGFEEKITRRLLTITVSVDVPSPTQIRQYLFGYAQDPDTALSLLSTASEPFPSANPTPPPATTFSYGGSAHAVAIGADLTFVPPVPTPPVVSRSSASGGVGNATMGFLDVDGDGLPEFLDGYSSLPSGQGSTGGLEIYRNRGGGRFEKDAGFWTTNAKITGTPPWPWNGLLNWSYLNGPIIRLTDIDGDGLPDLVRADSTSCVTPPNGATTCSWNVWKNNAGALNSTATSWPGVPVGLWTYLPTQQGANWAALIDLNGDGLSDILDCTGVNLNVGPYSCKFYQNNGSGFATGVTWLVPIANDPSASRAPLVNDGYKQLMDVNGDGLPDLVCSRPLSGTGRWDVWLNTGSGFLTTPVSWAAPPFSGAAYGLNELGPDSWPEEKRGLRDMNGDGLPDYVDAATAPWTVYLNTGGGFATAGKSWTGTTGVTYISVSDSFTSVLSLGTTFDVNGDGVADYVSTPSGSTTYQVRYGVAPRNNLLIHQYNGMGGSVDVAYVPSTDPAAAGTGCVGGPNWGAPCMTNQECPSGTCAAPSPDSSQLPFATWVVQTLSMHSGLTGTGHDLAASFTYTGGYFDPTGHQFRGFRQSVETRVADGRKVRRQFAPPPFQLGVSPPWFSILTSRPFKLIAEEVWSGAQVLTRATIDWDTPYIGGGRSQIHPTKRVDTTFSTATGVTTTKVRTETFNTYDTYNNVTQDTVTPDPADGLSAIVTTTTYGAAGSCHGQPTEIKVTSGRVLSDKLFAYTPDLKCNLLTVKQWLAPYPQDATAGSLVTTLTVAYDTTPAGKAGQPTTITDALSHATTLDYTTGCAAQGLFPCKITNALSQTTQKTYDLKWGRPTQINEPSGAITSMAYDGLGRLTSITRPLDTTAWRQFVYTFGTGGGSPTPSRIDTLIREPNANPSGSRTVSTFYDSFGRPLETKQQQYVGLVGSVVAKDAVAFDSAGRVATRFTPFTTAAAVTTYTSPSTSGTTLAYDMLDRVTRTTNPDATYRTADYSTAGQTAALDENYNECATPTGKTASCPGAKTVEYRDALGRAFKSELSEGSTLKTRTATAYDGLNRVTSSTVTDTIANKTATTSFEYDSFSRRTKMTDPDSGPPGPSPPAAPGVWLYAYDNVSNLVYQDDPKTAQHIEFCYDVLNRVTRKLYPAGDTQQSAAAYASACSVANPAAPVLQYWYDALNDAQHPYTCDVNGIGRLCAVDESFVDTSSLRTIFIYDARGRVSREYNSRSMLGKSGVYTRTNIYDFADRLTGVTYPTNFSSTSETVQYAFDDFGQLDLVNSAQQTYASGMSYDIFGRNTLWIDGSGLRNTASFGSSSFNFRLTQLKVADAGGTTYEQFDYNNNYDVASNLKTLTDNTPTTRYASTSPLRNSWIYVYDGLGRLTSGQLTGASATAFTYDGLGNMTGGNQLTFAYTDTTHPHHISSTTPGGNTTYHDDGGLASRGDTDGAQPDVSKNPVTYDADGRVGTITTGDGHTIRSLYDFRGERVARIVDQGLAGQVITFYYGKWFDVTGGTLTRHMYLPNRLIADSPVAAPAGLTVARISDEERSIMLARAMHDAARWSPAVYPNYVLTAEEAAKLGGLIAFILLVLGCTPGRVRVGLAVARQSPFRRLRRGHVILIVMVFGMTLTPLTCVRPAHAGGSGGSPPPGSVFPVYFIHSDHLGSTVMLTCYKQGATCPDATVARYYRYDAYGQTKAYDVNGNAVLLGSTLVPQCGVSYIPERLYTGQRWDWQAQVYYYGARFYDPKVGNFLTEDPARQYANPYAYVAWNPTKRTDPTGMVFSGGDAFGALSIGMQLQSAYVAAGYAALLAMRGLSAQSSKGPSTAGSGGNFAGFLAAASSHVATVATMLAESMGGAGGHAVKSATAQALSRGVSVELATGTDTTVTVSPINDGMVQGFAVGTSSGRAEGGAETGATGAGGDVGSASGLGAALTSAAAFAAAGDAFETSGILASAAVGIAQSPAPGAVGKIGTGIAVGVTVGASGITFVVGGVLVTVGIGVSPEAAY